MATISDSEFGDIVVRRNSRSRAMRASVAPNGTLRISLPPYVPLIMAKRMIHSSRDSLRKLLSAQKQTIFADGMQIGKSHTLYFREGSTVKAHKVGQQLVVTLGGHASTDTAVQNTTRVEVLKILKKEAKHYLPRRLEYIAREHDFHYETVRFSHASTRWGSCSSNGTISLNIALMMLPFELIDYVLIHELAHTRQMNHSKEFWQIVEHIDPQYLLHRRAIKKHTPNI